MFNIFEIGHRIKLYIHSTTALHKQLTEMNYIHTFLEDHYVSILQDCCFINWFWGENEELFINFCIKDKLFSIRANQKGTLSLNLNRKIRNKFIDKLPKHNFYFIGVDNFGDFVDTINS